MTTLFFHANISTYVYTPISYCIHTNLMSVNTVVLNYVFWKFNSTPEVCLQTCVKFWTRNSDSIIGVFFSWLREMTAISRLVLNLPLPIQHGYQSGKSYQHEFHLLMLLVTQNSSWFIISPLTYNSTHLLGSLWGHQGSLCVLKTQI